MDSALRLRFPRCDRSLGILTSRLNLGVVEGHFHQKKFKFSCEIWLSDPFFAGWIGWKELLLEDTRPTEVYWIIRDASDEAKYYVPSSNSANRKSVLYCGEWSRS